MKIAGRSDSDLAQGSSVGYSFPEMSDEVFYTLVIGIPALVVVIAIIVAVVLLSTL